jgi:hypothetical protein
MPPPTRCLLSSPRPSPVWLHSSLGSVKANFEDGDASRWAQDRSARSKNERRHFGTPSYVTIGLTAELRKDSSDEPLSCRIFMLAGSIAALASPAAKAQSPILDFSLRRQRRRDWRRLFGRHNPILGTRFRLFSAAFRKATGVTPTGFQRSIPQTRRRAFPRVRAFLRRS